MGELSPIHWMIVIGVVVLLFGGKRLPDAARAVGQSLRILQAETRGMRRDEQPDGPTAMTTATPTATPTATTTTSSGTEHQDAAERTGTTPGLDRVGGGDHGVPGTGDVDDRHDALPGAGRA